MDATDVRRELPFAEDAAVRRITDESVLLLGGGRALLMQLAHPLVAQGVDEHSSFRSNRLARLLRTLRPTLAIIHGDRSQSEAAAAGINALHRQVKGEGYAATDPVLLLWVLATLIDTTLEMHARFIGPVPSDDAESYYAGMTVMGERLGIPANRLPEDLSAFYGYFNEALDTLEVSALARQLATELFEVSSLPWLPLWPYKHLTAGLLPEKLRIGFGLSWDTRRELGLAAMCSASRAVMPRLPRFVRRQPWFLMPGR